MNNINIMDIGFILLCILLGGMAGSISSSDGLIAGYIVGLLVGIIIVVEHRKRHPISSTKYYYFCQECSYPLEDNEQFCPKCSTRRLDRD